MLRKAVGQLGQRNAASWQDEPVLGIHLPMQPEVNSQSAVSTIIWGQERPLSQFSLLLANLA